MVVSGGHFPHWRRELGVRRDGLGVIGGVAGLKSRRCFLVVVGGGKVGELVAVECGVWVRVWVRVLGYGSYGVNLDCYGIICKFRQ